MPMLGSTSAEKAKQIIEIIDIAVHFNSYKY